MKFSLIVPTKNRTEQLDLLFASLAKQTLKDFELIISDQNDDDRLVNIIKKFGRPEKVIHIRSSNGVSRARNAGLAVATGDIVTFPDDDCTYFPDLLERVARFFDEHPEYGYLSGSSVASDGGDAASIHAQKAGDVRKFRIHRQGIEFALFIRRTSLGNLRFDGNLGTGGPTPWQSDEGPDLMLNLENQGAHGYYDPSFKIWHPRPFPTFDEKMVTRCYRYSCGNGYFLRKHKYPWWFFMMLNGRTLLGAVWGLLTLKRGKARYYWARIVGRWVGWYGYNAQQAKAMQRSSAIARKPSA